MHVLGDIDAEKLSQGHRPSPGHIPDSCLPHFLPLPCLLTTSCHFSVCVGYFFRFLVAWLSLPSYLEWMKSALWPFAFTATSCWLKCCVEKPLAVSVASEASGTYSSICQMKCAAWQIKFNYRSLYWHTAELRRHTLSIISNKIKFESSVEREHHLHCGLLTLIYFNDTDWGRKCNFVSVAPCN